jgi:hypothetical protein
MTRLAPYGSVEHAHVVSKVGKAKTPQNLAARMPSPEIAAKVGTAAMTKALTHRVKRLNAAD